MDATLQRLLDEHEIAKVQIRYGLALDARDWDTLRTCFTPDAVTEYEGLGRFEGYQAIEDLCKTALVPLDRSQHLLGNHSASVDGDEATAVCYLHAQHVKEGTEGGDQLIIAGRYVDRLVRTGDGWRIRHRSLESWWTAGNPAVIGG